MIKSLFVIYPKQFLRMNLSLSLFNVDWGAMTCPNISQMYSHEARGDLVQVHWDQARRTLTWAGKLCSGVKMAHTGDCRTLKSDPAMTGSPLANKNSSQISVNQPGAELFNSYQFLYSDCQVNPKVSKKYFFHLFSQYRILTVSHIIYNLNSSLSPGEILCLSTWSRFRARA